MQAKLQHSWDLSPQEAIALQIQLAKHIEYTTKFNLENVRYIAGIDCAPSVDKLNYFAAAVIWDLQTKSIVEYHLASHVAPMPYIPGLLSFREIPAILEVITKIKRQPDVLIVDGQGIAHPRKIGIATHLGVLLDMPTLGCAKKVLYGKYIEPGLIKGAISPLMAKGEIIGNVIRTKNNVRPLIVSIGNKIDLVTATQLVMLCNNGYRLPEPTRLADKLVAKKEEFSYFAPANPTLLDGDPTTML